MLTFCRNILLWLSFGLLLMHSLVPHHHSDHHNCQDTHFSETAQPKNPFAFFLQTQLGEGHLENFLSEEQSPSNPVCFLNPDKTPEVAFVFHSVGRGFLRSSKDQVFYNSYLDYQKPLRAPPVLG